MEPFITSLQKRKPSQILCSCQYKRARCKVSSEVSGAALKLQEHRGPSLTLHHGVLMGKQRVWHWCFQAREQAGANGSWRFQTNVMMADSSNPLTERKTVVSMPRLLGVNRMMTRRKTRKESVFVWKHYETMLGQSLVVSLNVDSGWSWTPVRLRNFSQPEGAQYAVKLETNVSVLWSAK